MIPFSMSRDINGYNGFGLDFTDAKYSTTLVAGIEQTLTVPKSPFGQYPNVLAIFSFAPGSSIWTALNSTAVVPGGSFASVSSELNPASRRIPRRLNSDGSEADDVLHFITNDASDEVGVIFYATL